ncbi:multiple sugar transport system permease protein [Rhizobium sp. BK529]|uniref:carbohydrate ABC transporter permease n=1 Tax=unclassified Rhizobium TaxID=2613769 RepID=UPI00104BFBC2|nr:MULTISPECIES: sugar ABC transporter permease [unclassified Rhizobium]MBB3593702.1 multiple sugar transport system permease protein [Rhizobium sp. BK529]TCR94658.1 carbohydrate ABC transporter membrane protein 1 (CUT1 family) [Rhizobium sp. BK418]
MTATIERRQTSQLRRAQAATGYLFVLPAGILYLTFVIAPVIVTTILAFAYYDPMLGSQWVGFDNFVRFFTDQRSLQILWNTLRFALFAVTFNVSIGLLLALALNRAMPGWLLYFFRLAFFLPVIIAAAFVSIVWTYFYGDDLGVINYYLRLIGLPGVRWLTNAGQAMTSIIIMDVWKNTGFFMIIFIAALQGVPKNILEAAVMDGTPAWRQFFRITLPYISPVVFFCIVYASIGALQVFESIVILTQGGPGDATRSLSIQIVEEGFGSFQIGYAASISVVMTVIILIITAIQQIVSRKWVQQ